MTHTRTLSVLLLATLIAGCTANEVSWSEAAKDSLSPAQQAQLEKATAAKDGLAKNLMARLVEGMQTGGASMAIDVCKVAAPEIAQSVSGEQGVMIGRTSHKLRNPKNAPPYWAASYVAEQRAEPVVLTSDDDGSLAVLFPIKLKAECVQCHGPKEGIMPDVQEALNTGYPKDQATGFNEGDLRGWFHVVVPAA